jgi:hypothetical protein
LQRLGDLGKSWENVYGDDIGVFLKDLCELHQITEKERQKTNRSEGDFSTRPRPGPLKTFACQFFA